MQRAMWCVILIGAAASSLWADVVLDEQWGGQPIGAAVGELDGWAVAHGQGVVTLQPVDGQPMLVFAADGPNTAIAAEKRLQLDEAGSLSVSAVIRDLPDIAGPFGVSLRGYDADNQRLDSYWFMFDPGRRALLIKRGKENLASLALPDIRKQLNDPGWTPGNAHTYRFDVTFADGHAELTLCIDGRRLITQTDTQPLARFATAELLLYSYNRNDVAYGPIRAAVPAPAPCPDPAPEAQASRDEVEAVAAAPDAKKSVLATAVDPQSPEDRRALIDQIRKQFVSHGDQLRIEEVTPVADRVAQYDRYEIRFGLVGEYINPFDPQDVRVDAKITRPDGSEITVPAFYMRPYEPVDGKTKLEARVQYRPTGDAGWRLRYAPTQAGEHSVVLIAALPGKGQSTRSQPIIFNAEASTHPGYVRVSQGNPLYFENSGDETLFFATGVNLPWTRTRKAAPYTGEPEMHYEYYFAKAAEAEMSATRIWQCHYGWIEWTPRPGEPADSSWSGYAGLGYYNQMVGAAFDRIFEMAEASDIRVMLVLDDNNEHDAHQTPHTWDKNAYNVINGGPCARPSDIFTNPQARTAYRNRLRYVMARWGYSTSLWALNSWNDCRGLSPGVLPWFREMHGYVHELAGDWRPVIYGTNYREEAQAVSDYAQAEVAELVPGKPNVIQEGYFSKDQAWFVDTLRYVLWSNMARGLAGVMVWPHPLVDGLDAWDEFHAVEAFLDGIPLHRRSFQPIDAEVTMASTAAAAPLRAIGLAPYGDIRRWADKATRERFEIDPRGGSQFLEGMAPKLYGQREDRLQWRTTPTFVFDLPGAGSMIMEVSDLSGSDMHLVVTDHGQPLKNFPLEGEGKRKPTSEQQFLRIPLKAGPHELTFSLEGPQSDWLDIRRLMLAYREADPARILDLKGLSSSDHAVLYLRNVTGGELTQKVLGQPLVPVEDVEITIRKLRPGAYVAVIFDIAAGGIVDRRELTADPSGLVVSLPRVERHMAVRIMPAGP